MKTEVFDCTNKIDKDGIEKAAKMLRNGELVIMPTETVYGLAANALDTKAVADIFTAKGRPQDNPLIVHVGSADWLPKYALEIPDEAKKLIDKFWPGPLTIILKKSSLIPDIVSAGLDTAAFRCPSHPVAHALIEAAGVPIAAPSANISGKPSPTLLKYCMEDMDGKVSAVVDGGPCGVGVESTVITLCGGVPRVLRPGGVTPKELESVLGKVEIDPAVVNKIDNGQKVASPGMKYKHYAPKAHVMIVKASLEKMADFVNKKAGEGVATLCFEGEEKYFSTPCVTYGSRDDDLSQAQRLFDALREVDEIGAKTVYASCPRMEGVGLAVYNRLIRAAAFEVIEL